MFLEVYRSFYPGFFSYVGKLFDKEAKVSFKIYEVINWEKHDCDDYNVYIVQYLRKYRESTMEFGPLIECNIRNIFL